ncbi:MAG TPA: preprotein translocase subunit SecE [Acidimicrobiales bacterium]|nr:preprotein translocase subunit SecE [Acidimicrobiales bacterium]
MNREQKRMMQRQGQVGADGDATSRRQTTVQDVQRRKSPRTTPAAFLREVREEMRQVAWPTRPEVINYTTIVFCVLVFMTSLIFGLGFGFSKFVTFLFHK